MFHQTKVSIVREIENIYLYGIVYSDWRKLSNTTLNIQVFCVGHPPLTPKFSNSAHVLAKRRTDCENSTLFTYQNKIKSTFYENVIFDKNSGVSSTLTFT